MIRKLTLALLVTTLTACALLPGDSATLPTPIPTLVPAITTTIDPSAAPVPALGGKQSGDLLVWIFSDPNPPIRGSNLMEALITDANGQPVTDATVSFDLNMTNMNHGKNVVAASALGAGWYNGEVFFQMPGPWRVIVAIERAGQASRVRFDFNVNFR